jgi:glycerol-3-phosphate dehydrogenase (NAD(P)+)
MKIAVLGAGSWGTALAVHATGLGHEVVLWTRSPERAAAMRAARRNERDLPGLNFPKNLSVSHELTKCLGGREAAVLAVPSQSMREILSAAAPLLGGGTLLLNVSKGLEHDSHKRMSQIGQDVLGAGVLARWATLSGPSFAQEVVQGQPTVTALASPSAETAGTLRAAVASPAFRVYTTADLTGVELGGSCKNVIAIASGIVRGLGFGYNTQAALMARGAMEIARLAVAQGASMETLMGAAGIGDLFLTCQGALSRNLQLGERLGRGEALASALDGIGHVVEGVRTAGAMCALARAAAVETPIAEQVRAVVENGKPPRQALDELLRREPQKEGLRLP